MYSREKGIKGIFAPESKNILWRSIQIFMNGEIREN